MVRHGSFVGELCKIIDSSSEKCAAQAVPIEANQAVCPHPCHAPSRVKKQCAGYVRDALVTVLAR